MNKLLYIILSLSILAAACGGPDKSKADKDTTAFSNNNATQELQDHTAIDTTSNPTTTENTAGASSAKGAQLIASFDCLTCHKEKEKLIGPPYIEVAKKYSNTPENINMLADKVIKGGSGNWGEVPMTPHPALSVSDTREMVKYILSLK